MLKRQLRPPSRRHWRRWAWCAALVLAVLMGAALGETAGARRSEGKAAAGTTATAPATGTATATVPPAASKDSQPLLELARQMGARIGC
jgi:multidrug efflux pump subunit AcrA (membrane-fusion protein)